MKKAIDFIETCGGCATVDTFGNSYFNGAQVIFSGLTVTLERGANVTAIMSYINRRKNLSIINSWGSYGRTVLHLAYKEDAARLAAILPHVNAAVKSCETAMHLCYTGCAEYSANELNDVLKGIMSFHEADAVAALNAINM